MKSKSSLNLLLLVQLATYSFLVNAQTPTDAPTSSPTVSTTVEGNAILAWIVFVIVCIICPGGICFACYYHVAKNRLRNNQLNQQNPEYYNQQGMQGHTYNANVNALPPHQNWVEAKAQVLQTGQGDVHYIDSQHIVTAQAFPQTYLYSNAPPPMHNAPTSRSDGLHQGGSIEVQGSALAYASDNHSRNV